MTQKWVWKWPENGSRMATVNNPNGAWPMLFVCFLSPSVDSHPRRFFCFWHLVPCQCRSSHDYWQALSTLITPFFSVWLSVHCKKKTRASAMLLNVLCNDHFALSARLFLNHSLLLFDVPYTYPCVCLVRLVLRNGLPLGCWCRPLWLSSALLVCAEDIHVGDCKWGEM